MKDTEKVTLTCFFMSLSEAERVTKMNTWFFSVKFTLPIIMQITAWDLWDSLSAWRVFLSWKENYSLIWLFSFTAGTSLKSEASALPDRKFSIRETSISLEEWSNIFFKWIVNCGFVYRLELSCNLDSEIFKY